MRSTTIQGFAHNLLLIESPNGIVNPPLGNWIRLGLISDVSQEQKVGIIGNDLSTYQVHQMLGQNPSEDAFWVRYPDGTNKHFNSKKECYAHAIDMEFKHFLEANGVVFENKYGKEMPNQIAYIGDVCELEVKNQLHILQLKWRNTQKKVWDPKRTYVFISKPISGLMFQFDDDEPQLVEGTVGELASVSLEIKPGSEIIFKSGDNKTFKLFVKTQ